MKKISKELKEHFGLGVTTLCYCWKLKLKNGLEYGFTEFERNLLIDGLYYNAKSGFNPSAISSSSNLSVDNLEIDGILDHEVISEDAIMAGDFDYAEIEIFVVNYNDLSMGKLHLRKGWFGEINLSNNRFSTEVRGLVQAFSKNIGDLYSPTCRASFCDSKCSLNSEDFKFRVNIEVRVNERTFKVTATDKPNGFFNNGKMIFGNGDSIEIKSYFNNIIETVLPYFRDVASKTEVTLVAGCDKSFKTCIEKFKNALNFRAEPHVPGLDKVTYFKR